jgi:hypothetical protein
LDTFFQKWWMIRDYKWSSHLGLRLLVDLSCFSWRDCLLDCCHVPSCDCIALIWWCLMYDMNLLVSFKLVWLYVSLAYGCFSFILRNLGTAHRNYGNLVVKTVLESMFQAGYFEISAGCKEMVIHGWCTGEDAFHLIICKGNWHFAQKL